MGIWRSDTESSLDSGRNRQKNHRLQARSLLGACEIGARCLVHPEPPAPGTHEGTRHARSGSGTLTILLSLFHPRGNCESWNPFTTADCRRTGLNGDERCTEAPQESGDPSQDSTMSDGGIGSAATRPDRPNRLTSSPRRGRHGRSDCSSNTAPPFTAGTRETCHGGLRCSQASSWLVRDRRPPRSTGSRRNRRRASR